MTGTYSAAGLDAGLWLTADCRDYLEEVRDARGD